MNALIRSLRTGADGVTESQDAEARVDSITLGSAADRTIQLLGHDIAARHASIARTGAGFRIRCASGQKVRVNDVAVTVKPLEIGDRIEIGGHRLRVIAAPAGFDFALEVQLSGNVDARDFERAFRTDLDQTWLSRRAGAWILGVLTLSLALVIPLESYFIHRHGRAMPSGLPDDSWWSAGPLIPAHQLVIAAHANPARHDPASKSCNACHENLFIHVRDPACKQCHKSVMDHVPAADLVRTKLGAAPRCAQCHRDHDGGASLLALRADDSCVACHADRHAAFGPLKVATVSGFSRGNAHPPFSMTSFKPPADESPGGSVAADQCVASDKDLADQLAQWLPVREPVKQAHDESHLKFSHKQHLDEAQMHAKLECASCHTPEPDGEHFVPVTMARTCATGGCHQLTFDARAPELPHGKPCEAMFVIEDFYARLVSGDPTLRPKPREVALRLPDREQSQAIAKPCESPGFACAHQRAEEEIQRQFGPKGSGCISCHVVRETQGPDIYNRYRVMPVRLTYDYFPDTHFRHKDHLVQKDLSGQDACLSCHPANKSESSTDVLIPDIDKCQECHSDRPIVDQVAVQCVSCHTYHPMPIMQASRGADAKQ
jgi:hypothetical protein